MSISTQNSYQAVSVNSYVMVVDDDRGLRRIISHIMEEEGYKVIEAQNGREALKLCQSYTPDLVLLDAMMPEMDGFETCQQLHKYPGLQDVPVLMITALADSQSVDEAFRVGAVDYINKPINWSVLRHRVRRLLLSREAEKLRDDLIHMIVHDMKNPLASIYGHLDLLLTELDGELNPPQRDSVERAYRNTQQLLDMTTMLLDLKRLEEGKLKLQRHTEDLMEIISQVVDNLQWMARSYGVSLVVENNSARLSAMLDWSLLRRVLTNLISNAIKHSPRDKQIIISAYYSRTEELEIKIKDYGEGIRPEDQLRIFDKYTQAMQRSGGSRTDSGLGLTFCKLAVEAHHGRIELESVLNQGTTFTLIFPNRGLLLP